MTSITVTVNYDGKPLCTMPIDTTKDPRRLEVAMICKIGDDGRYRYHANVYIDGKFAKARTIDVDTLAEAAKIAEEYADALLPEQMALIA
jgi:hypothetical protein